jgi:hypothetical protein
MSLKHVAFALILAVSIDAIGCCEQKGADPQVAELKARVAALEAANKALEKQLAEARPADGCAAQLAACTERAAKCEKDPFTGPKYLSGEPGDKAAAGEKPVQ